MKQDAFDIAVGARLKRERVARRWTQRMLATDAELSPNFVARVERGEVGLSLRTAKLIAEALDISIDSFA